MQNKKHKLNRVSKKAVSLLLAGLMAATLPACGKDAADTAEPTTSRAPIDKSKTARNLVKQAEQGAYASESSGEPEPAKIGDYTTDGAKAEEGKASDLKEIDRFKTAFESDNKLMKVDVDAPVLVAECDAYPILSVTRGTIDNTLLKKAKEALLGDTQLYDGTRLYDPWEEDCIARGDEPDPAWDLQGKVPLSEISQYPVDTKLESVKTEAQKKGDLESFQKYYMDLIPDGELFYGVTDGKDESYASLCVTNSDRYGSSLKFWKSQDYPVQSGLVLPGVNIYSWPVEKGEDYVFNNEKNPSPPIGMPSKMTPVTLEDGEIQWQGDGSTDPDFKGCTVRISTKETNQVSKEDATRQAEELLKTLGLTGEYAPTVVQEEYVTDLEHLNDGRDADGKYGYEFLLGKAWHIIFERSVNGNVLQDFGEKYTYRGGKRVWFGEVVEVYVNDNGIVGLAVSDPLKVEETVVENGKLLDFDEIRSIYEKNQLEALNGSTMFDSLLTLSEEEAEKTQGVHYSFKIDEISLRYARITEQNEFEKALLVPVWSFCGSCYDENGKLATEGSFLEINAVDGTVYNAQIGY